MSKFEGAKKGVDAGVVDVEKESKNLKFKYHGKK